MNLKVGMLSTALSRSAAGVFTAIVGLSHSLQRMENTDVQCFGLGSKDDVDSSAWGDIPVNIFPVIGPKQFCYAPKIIKNMEVAGIDVLHSHGMWMYPSLAGLKWQYRTGNPYVISTHGMLEPWALSNSRWKKRVALLLFERRHLQQASILHATSMQEANSLRKFSLTQPIAIIPNGVGIPKLSEPTTNTKNLKTALFLSRVHPKKGLINLVRAWAKNSPADWQVIIAGPDEGGHQAEVEQEIQRNGLAGTFKFTGTVEDTDKWKLYSSADLFVLPTHSENFGIVVAEALASGLPVITTKGAPWVELEEHKCGWWIDIGVDPLAKALEEAINLPSEERQAMGQRGRLLVAQNYSWDKIGQEMVSVYEWVLGRREVPECVMMD